MKVEYERFTSIENQKKEGKWVKKVKPVIEENLKRDLQIWNVTDI